MAVLPESLVLVLVYTIPSTMFERKELSILRVPNEDQNFNPGKLP